MITVAYTMPACLCYSVDNGGYGYGLWSKVCIYQKCNQKPQVLEEQTTQWKKKKMTTKLKKIKEEKNRDARYYFLCRVL
jgi:hypothetical protein